MSGRKSVRSRVRWSVAHHANRLPWTCWANLVSWALRERQHGSPRLIDLSGNQDDVRIDWMCRTPNSCGRCYCGKIAVAEGVTQP